MPAVTHPAQPPRRGGVRLSSWWGRAWLRAVEESAYTEADLTAGRSIARGGRVVVPDALEQPIALVDARDLAGWLVAMAGDGVAGPVNAVAPEPVTAKEFAAILGRVLRRPAAVPTPGFGPRLRLAIAVEVGDLGHASPRCAPDRRGRSIASFAAPVTRRAKAGCGRRPFP